MNHANSGQASHHEHHFAHHFENANHEFISSKFGMWLLLVTEILLFGGLFVAYAMYRGLYPDMFHEASHHLNKVMGGVNTVVLICSSLSMAMAVGMAQRNQPKKSLQLMFITLVCAGMFLVIKYFEYSHKIHDGLLPGAYFTNKELTAPNASLFYSLYFLMTGLHGLHVVIGMGLIAWVMFRTARNEFHEHYYTPVELVGLYWHLVDLIWIYLFPLLYLIG